MTLQALLKSCLSGAANDKELNALIQEETICRNRQPPAAGGGYTKTEVGGAAVASATLRCHESCAAKRQVINVAFKNKTTTTTKFAGVSASNKVIRKLNTNKSTRSDACRHPCVYRNNTKHCHSATRNALRVTCSILFLFVVFVSLAPQNSQVHSSSVEQGDSGSSEPSGSNSLTTGARTTTRPHRTPDNFFTSLFNKLTTPQEPTTTPSPETTTEQQDELASAGDDDDDAEGCSGISAHESAEGKNISEVERLVNLQSCIQRKVKRRLASYSRSGMDIFDKLSLSGGCTSSLMNLMVNLGEIKSFAFKFIDASAKLPSGIMYGLLSDFGDFDQCMSIRSNPNVPLESEDEERAYSGKYCLMNVRLNYHIKLEPNVTVPEGIQEDGVLWDELMRNYWTSKTNKGFQVGMCFPSRCTQDDLDQLYRLVAESYNIKGEIISCQDGMDLRRQHSPDLIQQLIIYSLYPLLLLTLIGSLIERYSPGLTLTTEADSTNRLAFIFQLLVCFSISRNWQFFMRKDNCHQLRQTNWDCLTSGAATNTTAISAHNPVQQQATKINVTPAFQLESPSSAQSNLSTLATTNKLVSEKLCQLHVKIQPDCMNHEPKLDTCLDHLSGLRLFVIFWITMGHSFLYPSANNYQHYRSIISMNITRDSVWFATTNFTLGIDMLLYITGLAFVHKLADLRQRMANGNIHLPSSGPVAQILWLISKKILRFWPTYLAVIAIAIVVPLLSDGPMWPEMVSKRIGGACRQNWWSNLLFINNFLSESEICLPSSWFISVIMQLFLIGSMIVLLEHRYSLNVALLALSILLSTSCLFSFTFAYLFNVRAPAIRMDETFVMEIDDNIWRLYINIFNNLGPFLVGMAGGYLLLKHQSRLASPASAESPKSGWKAHTSYGEILVGLLVLIVAATVLSSVFHQEYTRFWAAIYWSLHRVGWALVTGYIIHNCATGKWLLLNDLLSLSTFIPFSRLIFIAYLLYPIFIYMHSGLVRDGLHVSIYNMLNIYITRLVMTFSTALLVHLLVELPFCSIEEIYLNRWTRKLNNTRKNSDPKRIQPLLAVAPIIETDSKTDLATAGKTTKAPSDNSNQESEFEGVRVIKS